MFPRPTEVAGASAGEGSVRKKADGKSARGNASHSTEGAGEHPTFFTLTNMRVLRLNEDVTLQNAQAAGVDVSG